MPSIVNEKGECGYHDPLLLNRSKLQKQTRIKNLLDEYKINIYSYDKIVDFGICNKRRPDLVIDCKTHFVVVEVDENQHKYYNDECEKIRMLEILQSLGLPVIFIRYNPDTYKPKLNSSEFNLKYREKLLIECINTCMINIPENEEHYLRIIYLFFDNYELDTTYKLIDIKLPSYF